MVPRKPKLHGLTLWTGFDDITAPRRHRCAKVGEPVEQRCCHFCITEDLRPFTEAKVGRDDEAGAFIELAQKVE